MQDLQNIPKTEEGLQFVLNYIQQAKAEGDELKKAHGLLAHGFLVKWVRSDTDAHPFDRARELAEEALEIFERLGDRLGQAKALRAAASMHPKGREMLERAIKIAEEEGDELAVAAGLDRLASQLNFQKQKDLAREKQLQALEIFERLNYNPGIGMVCFGLCLSSSTDAEKLTYATRSATAYQEAGRLSEAIKSYQLVLMYMDGVATREDEKRVLDTILSLAEQEGSVDAQRSIYTRYMKYSKKFGTSKDVAAWKSKLKQLDIEEGTTPAQRKMEMSLFGKQFAHWLRKSDSSPEAKEMADMFDKEDPKFNSN